MYFIEGERWWSIIASQLGAHKRARHKVLKKLGSEKTPPLHKNGHTLSIAIAQTNITYTLKRGSALHQVTDSTSIVIVHPDLFRSRTQIVQSRNYGGPQWQCRTDDVPIVEVPGGVVADSASNATVKNLDAP